MMAYGPSKELILAPPPKKKDEPNLFKFVTIDTKKGNT